jgi:hypothetical protein
VEAVVMANANYASYVEGVADDQGRFGRGKKTPFLGPALLEMLPVFRKAIQTAVRNARAR